MKKVLFFSIIAIAVLTVFVSMILGSIHKKKSSNSIQNEWEIAVIKYRKAGDKVSAQIINAEEKIIEQDSLRRRKKEEKKKKEEEKKKKRERHSRRSKKTLNFNGQIKIPISSRIAYVHNNPGNLIYAGQAGAKKGEKKKNGGHWAKFETPENGFKALLKQVEHDKEQDLNLSDFIHKFAPAYENGTKRFIERVIMGTGISKNQKIKNIPTELLAVIIAKIESGTEVPYFFKS